MANPDPTERGLPSNTYVEKMILGSCLQSTDKGAISEAIMRLEPDDFMVDKHRKLHSCFKTLLEKGVPIDHVIVYEWFSARGQSEVVGGLSGIVELEEGLPDQLNLTSYVETLKRLSGLRRVIYLAREATERAFLQESQPAEIAGHFAKGLSQVANEHEDNGAQSMAEFVDTYKGGIDALMTPHLTAPGIPVGFPRFDELTDGLHEDEILTVGAYASTGKCVAADTLVLLGDGSLKTAEQVYKERFPVIVTLDEGMKVAKAYVSDYVDDGVKPTFKVRLNSGREVTATAAHPFLTLGGWQPLAQLRLGTRIAVPSYLNVFGDVDVEPEFAKLLGYLLGDGSFRPLTISFTNSDERIIEEFSECCSALGFKATISRADKPSPDGKLRSPSLRIRKARRKNGPNPFTTRIREMGLIGTGSHSKFIPDEVFTWKKPLIATFLNRLFATDGWAASSKVGAPGSQAVGYCSVSEKMIRGVQHLLLRFGVHSRIRKRPVKYKYKGTTSERSAWSLDISDPPSVCRFADQVGIFSKEDALDKVRSFCRLSKRGSPTQNIPVGVVHHIGRVKGSMSWSELGRRCGVMASVFCPGKETEANPGAGIGRFAILRAGKVLDDTFLQDLATSDITWDWIESIEFVGHQQVYDLTIPGTHNFVANDIFVHNTSIGLTWCRYIAEQLGLPVAVFSLEMSKRSLFYRMICDEAQVSFRRFRQGAYSEADSARLRDAARLIYGLPIYVDERSGVSPADYQLRLQSLKDKYGVRVAMIDYAQLMQPNNKRVSGTERMSSICTAIQDAVKKTHIPLILLSQLNREQAKAKRKPEMFDLRETGVLENISDIVAMIWRESVTNRDKSSLKDQATLLIRKARNTETKEIGMRFIGWRMRFEELTEEEEDAQV